MEIGTFLCDVLRVDDVEILKQVSEITTAFSTKKGNLVITQGERQEDFIFLVTGIFRGFYLGADGKENTDCFGVLPGTPCMSVSINNGISPISIEAVTPCEFIKISGKQLTPLIDSNPFLLKIYNEILRTAMQIHWDLKIMVTQHTPMERYRWFLDSYPGLIDHACSKDIASFLGMSPVTFSRLKKLYREIESTDESRSMKGKNILY